MKRRRFLKAAAASVAAGWTGPSADGRCFSADQLALSSARVTTSCSMMGQAAGIAAALAVRKSCDPRELDPADVRKVVEARGAKLDV